MKPPRVLLIPTLLVCLWALVHSVVIIVDGLADELAKVDVIVVLGNQVNDDGSPSERLKSRLDRAAELYNEGYTECILLSGGIDPNNGRIEADDMASYLESVGIPRTDMIWDNKGLDTFGTAMSMKQFMEWYDWDSVLVVSNYYHIPRIKLAFKQAGIENVYSAHAKMFPELRDLYSIPREFVAYYYYLFRSYKESKPIYETATFSLEYPADWTSLTEGNRSSFVGSEADGSPTFEHFTGDSFEAPVWKNLETEFYINAQGLTWTIHYNKLDDEFISSLGSEYPDSFRFVTTNTEDESLSGFFIYSYDEELYPEAVDQLKGILDSYMKK
ncbi:YdcF family protein [Candidatus Peregrinibacteria bacterium]|nr:MAG: YdcF family protein [Candidatus Peregrinibacteria bacterium]